MLKRKIDCKKKGQIKKKIAEHYAEQSIEAKYGNRNEKMERVVDEALKLHSKIWIN